mmetsp:Transcript_6400/g.5708  ORF Transcript_6400/g.5708 Transcript_6400/m.5708 type:complete len:236 (-) Transcript_6400:507-1214(-)
MVSEAWSFLTRLFSFFIFMTEKAKAMVTARGRPSGTATTITVMAIIRKETKAERVSMWRSSAVSSRAVEMMRFTVMAMKVRMATYTPIFPISLAMVSNLAWRGVSSSSMFNFSSAMPDLVLVPTARIKATPWPDTIKVLARRKGTGLCSKLLSVRGVFSSCSGSPVRPLSSAATSVPSNRMQSAGTLIPCSSLMTSPTIKSSFEIVLVWPFPPLKVGIQSLAALETSFWNCFSLA